MSAEQRPATARQLRYLRSLARQRGETFAYPQTSAEASAEIERLKGRRRGSLVERRVEKLAVGNQISELGDAAAVREDEVVGYGSRARWR